MPSIGLLLLVFVGISASSPQEVMDGLILFAIVVASIFLHELGHAWGCRVQGVPVQRIVLHGGGGFCQHRIAGARASELIVIMGPLVNLALWALLSLAAHYTLVIMPGWDAVTGAEPGNRIAYWEVYFWLNTAASINLTLAVLNMIPVQPLDGGKLVHLWLLRVLSQDRALQVAGGLGLVCTVLWLLAMLSIYYYIGFILLFFPSFRMHWHMLRGGSRLRRLR